MLVNFCGLVLIRVGGIMRISYLVDANGIIEKVYSKVRTATHAMDVIESLDE